MARPKKDGTKATYIIENTILEELEEFCERTGRTKTKVVELAIKDYLENHKDEK